MTDAVLTDNDRKAELSFAYLAALAAKAGYTCQRGPQPDMASIDATVHAGDRLSTHFDVQLKATSAPDGRKADGLHFSLKKKNYDDLSASGRSVPIFLVVLELPPSEDEWVECSVEQLTLRRCGWWASLAGSDPIETDSKTITIPMEQRLSDDGVKSLMAQAAGSPP